MSMNYDVDLLWTDGTFSERVLVGAPTREQAVSLAVRVVRQFGPWPSPDAQLEASDVRGASDERTSAGPPPQDCG